MCVDSVKKKNPRRERKRNCSHHSNIFTNIRMHLLIYRLICISVETLTSITKKKEKKAMKSKKKVQSCRFIFDEKNRLRRNLVRVIQREK